MSAISTVQLDDYIERGWFVVRGLADTATVSAIREDIMQAIADGSEKHDLDLEARAGRDVGPIQRYRKLLGMGRRSRACWEGYFASPRLLAVARQLLGDHILIKYDSVFLKPPRSGSATPWHQDIGLWCDEQHNSLSSWMAIDPATKENGCMQFVSGSHRGPVVEHITYGDAVHAELPRTATNHLPIDHIELAPGDAVFWHSHLWHYSPPNRSDHGRIAIAGVWDSLSAALSSRVVKVWPWCMRRGETGSHLGELCIDSGVNAHPGFRSSADLAIPAEHRPPIPVPGMVPADAPLPALLPMGMKAAKAC